MLVDNKIPRHSQIITSLMSGATAGAIAKTTIAPLDRTKINFQISDQKRYSFRGAMKFLIRSVKDDGVLSLWRGNTATMARIVPYAALQYAAHEQWKHVLNPKRDKYLTPGRKFLAGSLAGVTASTLTYPLDMARARMAVTHKSTYKNLFRLFAHIFRNEGLRATFHGYSPTMLGVIPYAGTSFFTYETLKQMHSDYSGAKEPTPIHRLCFGAVAGLLGQTSSYPLDIVRRRMQTAGVVGKSEVYNSIFSSFTYIYRTEGIVRGFYKGLSMNWIKGPIAVGISFMTFDIVNKQLRNFLCIIYHTDVSDLTPSSSKQTKS